MERAREVVAVLLNDVWHSVLVKFGYVSSRILLIKFKYVGYDPAEGDDEESDRFWNDMDRTPDCVGSGYRLCILGDLNG